MQFSTSYALHYVLEYDYLYFIPQSGGRLCTQSCLFVCVSVCVWPIFVNKMSYKLIYGSLQLFIADTGNWRLETINFRCTSHSRWRTFSHYYSFTTEYTSMHIVRLQRFT